MAFLRKRGNTWYVQYKIEGRWKRVSCQTSVKKIAQEVLAKYRVNEIVGVHELPRKNKINLGELVEKYFEKAQHKLTPRWFHNKKLIIEGYILPFFGKETLLKDITPQKIEEYRQNRSKVVSDRTINIEIHHCLISLLRQAVDWGLLESRHFPKLKKLKETKGRLRFLSEKEIKALLESAHIMDLSMEIYVRLMLYAGLRSGEALALRWKDLDLARAIVIIAPREGWSTKTQTSRSIPLPHDLVMFLQQVQSTYPLAEYIVTSSGEYSAERIKRLFLQATHLAGLPTEGEDKVTAHTLRHTYASHLVMNGTPLYTVSALLGHSDAKTTQIYAHLAPEYLKEAVNKLGF